MARYDKALARRPGDPFLFCVVPNPGGSASEALRAVEAFVLALAWRKNPGLGATQGKTSPAWSISGLVPGGTWPDAETAAFLGMLGVKR